MSGSRISRVFHIWLCQASPGPGTSARTGTSARLGVVIYFIPFFFVFNPSLILEGKILETLYLFAMCLLGIMLIAGGMEGHLVKVGRLSLAARPLLVLAGLLIAYPEWKTTIIGAALALFVIAIIWISKKALRTESTTINKIISTQGQ